jgi:dihydroflavonol-4-reductase
MKVAVTGATGHIGTNLCRQLLESGYEVRAMIHKESTGLDGLPVEMVKGDVLNPHSLDNLLDGMEAVFHLAAIISIEGDPTGRVLRVNVEGTRNVVEACLRKKVRRLVHFSSIHAFKQRPVNKVLDETSARSDHRNFKYDQSKVMGEAEVRKGFEQGLETVILHPSAVLGPWDFHPSRMGQLLLDLQKGKIPALVNGGFDWVDARDVAAAAITALQKGRNGSHYLLSGKWRSVRELAEVIQQTTPIKVPRISVPIWLAHIGVPFAKIQARIRNERPLFTFESLETLRLSNRHVSHSKATAELGYRPRPLEESIADSYKWFKDHGMI